MIHCDGLLKQRKRRQYILSNDWMRMAYYNRYSRDFWSPTSDEIDAEEEERYGRRDGIKEKIYQYLDERKDPGDKWAGLLKCNAKPDELDIPDTYWSEAQDIVKYLKEREEMSEMDDDGHFSPISYCPSSSASFSSCQSSSSTEFGALRVASPFCALAVPIHSCLKKESNPKQSGQSIHFGMVNTKIFYVSYRERRLKSEACPQEMVLRNSEESKLEPWERIKLDGADDLDRRIPGKLNTTERNGNKTDDNLHQKEQLQEVISTNFQSTTGSSVEPDCDEGNCYISNSGCDTSPLGSCRLIIVKPAPWSEYGESNESDELMDMRQLDDSNMQSKNVQDEGIRDSPIKLKWRRRVAENIRRKLRGLGKQITRVFCCACLKY